MNQEIVSQLQEVYGPIKWFPDFLKGIPVKGWFLLTINPLPPLGEREMVTSDIIHGGQFAIDQGRVHHFDDCTSKSHNISSKFSHVIKVLPNIKDQTFHIAVYPGEPGVLNGQPIAIPLEPTISYVQYPDHPHLNSGRYIKQMNLFIPDTLCYTDNPKGLGSDPFSRLSSAFALISEWLYRHQVWLETRAKGKSTWIGRQAFTSKPEEFAEFINPNGPCRCGKQLLYKDCHMRKDLQIPALLFSKQKAWDINKALSLIMKNLCINWKSTRYEPQLDTIERLSSVLLNPSLR